jgi:uncharacterized SAM-binding protein YcdF (DUF218 family)
MTYLTPVFPLLCAICLVAAFRMKPSPQVKLLRVAVMLLFLWSWPPVAWLMSASLECWYRPVPYPAGEAQALVVLAGGIHAPDPAETEALPNNHTYLRCQHAVWLYQHWRRLPIVVSGGVATGNIVFADVMRRQLESEGIPEDMIGAERTSSSTYENAANTAQLLRGRGIRRVVLVTEGFHMLRAEKSFERQGLAVLPSPCAFRMYEFRWSWEQLLPDAMSIVSNDDALHEWVGLLWYRISGKI